MSKVVLVTGGAGFIGSNFVRCALAETDLAVVVADKLTYAGNLENLAELRGDPRFVFERLDICDRPALEDLLRRTQPCWVVNFAAESHVDRSIDGPRAFVTTNLLGTFELLDATLQHWKALAESERDAFRVLHVSTDEVYGSLGAEGAFSEETAYAPNSPYAATKAGADHLARAYRETFGLPVLLTNSSNNYGPFQFPEKLLPLMVLNAERYNIGAGSERTNLDLVDALCGALETASPARENPALRAGGFSSYLELKTFVADRPGHDRRYAIDARKIRRELGWEPRTSLGKGLDQTVRWYLDHQAWCRTVLNDTAARTRRGLGTAPRGNE